MIKRPGADAALDAAKRPDELLADGDTGGCAVWMRILEALAELTHHAGRGRSGELRRALGGVTAASGLYATSTRGRASPTCLPPTRVEESTHDCEVEPMFTGHATPRPLSTWGSDTSARGARVARRGRRNKEARAAAQRTAASTVF
jgi:hypothetical protein